MNLEFRSAGNPAMKGLINVAAKLENGGLDPKGLSEKSVCFKDLFNQLKKDMTQSKCLTEIEDLNLQNEKSPEAVDKTKKTQTLDESVISKKDYEIDDTPVDVAKETEKQGNVSDILVENELLAMVQSSQSGLNTPRSGINEKLSMDLENNEIQIAVLGETKSIINQFQEDRTFAKIDQSVDVLNTEGVQETKLTREGIKHPVINEAAEVQGTEQLNLGREGMKHPAVSEAAEGQDTQQLNLGREGMKHPVINETVEVQDTEQLNLGREGMKHPVVSEAAEGQDIQQLNLGREGMKHPIVSEAAEVQGTEQLNPGREGIKNPVVSEEAEVQSTQQMNHGREGMKNPVVSEAVEVQGTEQLNRGRNGIKNPVVSEAVEVQGTEQLNLGREGIKNPVVSEAAEVQGTEQMNPGRNGIKSPVVSEAVDAQGGQQVKSNGVALKNPEVNEVVDDLDAPHINLIGKEKNDATTIVAADIQVNPSDSKKTRETSFGQIDRAITKDIGDDRNIRKDNMGIDILGNQVQRNSFVGLNLTKRTEVQANTNVPLSNQVEQKILQNYEVNKPMVFQMTLSPENLGDIDVQLKYDQGKLIIDIMALSKETQNLLGKEINQLVKSLALQNVKVESVNLNTPVEASSGGQNSATLMNSGSDFTQQQNNARLRENFARNSYIQKSLKQVNDEDVIQGVAQNLKYIGYRRINYLI